MDVAESLQETKRSQRLIGRIVDQMVGSGTSVGANIREADEALSRKDFCRALGIVLKELSESRFWLEFVRERGWISAARLTPLEKEAEELSKVFSVIVARTRRNSGNNGKR